MADDRYNRWQGLAIGQLTVAVALVSTLSVSSLAVGFSLLQSKEFNPCGISLAMFVGSFPLLLLAALSSFVAVVSRTLDFRLTARKVRKDKHQDYSRPLKIFRLGKGEYGKITWSAFWVSCATFLLGVISLFSSIGTTYGSRLG